MALTASAEQRRAYSVGTILVLLYTLCVSLVVVSFSAHVIRSDWDSRLTTSTEEVTDFNSLNFLMLQEAVLLREVELNQDEIDAHNETITDVTNRQLTTRAAVDEARLRLDETLDIARVHIVSAFGRLNSEQRTQLDLILPDLQTDDVGDLRSGLSFMAALVDSPDSRTAEATPPSVVVPDKALPEPVVLDPSQDVSAPEATRANVFMTTNQLEDGQSVWEQAAQLEALLLKARNDLHFAELSLQSADSDVERAHEARSFQEMEKLQLQKALQNIREDVPTDSSHRAQWSLIMEDNLWWNPMAVLISAPTILLTLLATIAAGALGTLVSFSRTTFKHGEISAGQLLIIIGEGIAAAIAVFLFAGAGMLVLSQGGGATGRLELSPFTVAFLAFLSGFMSEQAFDKIREKGGELFGKAKDDEDDGPGGAGVTADQTAQTG